MLPLQFVYLVGYVNDLFQIPDTFALYVDFLLVGHCPESFFQIIVFRSAELMDIAICTVVVGYEETSLGNHTSGTSELH